MRVNRGFTLIELLIVISIIGILAGMIMTPAPGLMNKSRDARIKQTLTSFRSAIHGFWMVNDGKYPRTLEELKPDFINEVPVIWRGATCSGIIYYDKNNGNVRLADKDGKFYNLPVDGKGVNYSKY